MQYACDQCCADCADCAHSAREITRRLMRGKSEIALTWFSFSPYDAVWLGGGSERRSAQRLISWNDAEQLGMLCFVPQQMAANVEILSLCPIAGEAKAPATHSNMGKMKSTHSTAGNKNVPNELSLSLSGTIKNMQSSPTSNVHHTSSPTAGAGKATGVDEKRKVSTGTHSSSKNAKSCCFCWCCCYRCTW